MARMKEIQKCKFLNWTDEEGRLTRFFRIGFRQDLVSKGVQSKELTVRPTTSTQVFVATDGVVYEKVTVLSSGAVAPTVEDETIIFTEGANTDSNILLI